MYADKSIVDFRQRIETGQKLIKTFFINTEAINGWPVLTNINSIVN